MVSERGYTMDIMNAQGFRDRDNLLIVDGLNLAFRYKYANQKIFAEKYVATVES